MSKINNPADTSNLVPYTGATANVELGANNLETTAHIKIEADNARLEFGDNQDANIKYDGTDLNIISDVAGSGTIKVSNGIEVTGTLDLETQTAKFTIPELTSLPGTPITGQMIIYTNRGVTELRWYNGITWKKVTLT